MQGSCTVVSLNSRLEGNKEEEEDLLDAADDRTDALLRSRVIFQLTILECGTKLATSKRQRTWVWGVQRIMLS